MSTRIYNILLRALRELPTDGETTKLQLAQGQSLAVNPTDLPPDTAGEPDEPKNPIRIVVVAGQTIDLTAIGLEAPKLAIIDGDLVLIGNDGSQVILENFVAVAALEAPPAVMLKPGVSIAAQQLVQRALSSAQADDTPDSPETDSHSEPPIAGGGGVGLSEPRDLGGFGALTPFDLVLAGVDPASGTFGTGAQLPTAPVPGDPSSTSGESESAYNILTAQQTSDVTADTVVANQVTLGGATPTTNALDTVTATPFSTYTIQHPNATKALTVTVTLGDPTDGAFTAGSLAASGFVNSGGGVYTFNGTAAATQTAIRQLVFDPADNLAALGATRTTTFTVNGADGGAGTVADNTTTVVATRATGTVGNDSVTLPIAITSGTVDLQGGTDDLTLANGTNTLTVSNVETINGGTGTDTVTLGTAGAVTVTATESLTGSGGADTVNLDQTAFGVLTDLDGGAGTDTLGLSAAGTYDLSGLAGFTGIENVTTTGNTTLTLRDGVNLLVTLDNATNTVTGGTGADTVVGGAGSDTLSGGGGADSLVGGVGADVLNGDAGNDSLAGGAGTDQLTGGADVDRFIFTVTDSQGVLGLADVISDFQDGTDFVVISGVADFDAMNGSDFADLSVTEVVDAGGVIDGATDTVVTDRTTGNIVAILDSVSAGAGDTINAADFLISA